MIDPTDHDDAVDDDLGPWWARCLIALLVLLIFFGSYAELIGTTIFNLFH